jgi:hypothetical protein
MRGEIEIIAETRNEADIRRTKTGKHAHIRG